SGLLSLTAVAMPTPARLRSSPAPSEWEAHRAARSGPLRPASGTVSNRRSQSRTIPRIGLLLMHQPSYSSSIPSERVHLRRQPPHEEARMECSFGRMESVQLVQGRLRVRVLPALATCGRRMEAARERIRVIRFQLADQV